MNGGLRPQAAGVVDSHAHLNHEGYQPDLDAVIARAREAGVVAILIPGYDLPSSREAVRLSERLPGAYASVGIHPHDAETCTDAALAELRALLKHPRVVGVGECGLDYYRDLSPRDVQQRVLRAHLALAREANRPIILHNRDSEGDLTRILREEGLPEAEGVLHCFSGDATLAAEALGMGLTIGVAGQVTFKNAAALREVIASLPLERLMVETDSPYLAPVPYRGRRNEPAHVVAVAECVALLHGTTFDVVANATTARFETLFGVRVTGG